MRHIDLKPSDYFYCDLCGNKFKRLYTLKSHLRFKHIENRRFECPYCPGRTWRRKIEVKKHIKSFHDKIRDFKCDQCGKGFYQRDHLKNHSRIHTGKMILLRRLFDFKLNFAINYLGELRYSCRYCERKFVHQTDWRRHEWGHTGYKGNIKCPNCNQRFLKNSDLQSHLTRCYHA